MLQHEAGPLELPESLVGVQDCHWGTRPLDHRRQHRTFAQTAGRQQGLQAAAGTGSVVGTCVLSPAGSPPWVTLGMFLLHLLKPRFLVSKDAKNRLYFGWLP